MLAIDLSGKVAVVTGGSGELGRALVRPRARAGADVAIHYLKNHAKACELVAEVAAMGMCAVAVQADVTDQGSVATLHDTVTAALGPADIIVNNALIQYDWKSVLDQPLEDYDSQFRSCVMQNVLMAKAFLPAMIEKGWGRVIGISTECVMGCLPGQSAYVAGKRGMDGMLRVLAREVGQHGITVNQVAPGWTVSEGRPDGGTEGEKSYQATVPLRRRGTDQDIANAVAFLACDLASFISGAYLPVCGGSVMPTV